MNLFTKRGVGLTFPIFEKKGWFINLPVMGKNLER